MRRWFAIVTLTLVGAFTALILLCAALLPDFEVAPEDEGRRLVRLGYKLTEVRYERPRFAADRFAFDRVECYEHASGDRHLIARIVLRPGDPEGAPSRPQVQAAVAVLVESLLPDAGEVAISRREVAVVTRQGILLRRARWENVTGGDVPSKLENLRSSAPVEERLSHPDRTVWIDAAIEACLARLEGRIFADALLRSPGSELPLLKLLLLSGDRNESARVVVETEDALLQLRLLDELTREDRTDALRRICARRWPMDRTSSYLRSWLVDRLEDGTFAGNRDEFRKIAQAADASCAARLRRIVEEQEGVGCAAAYLILTKQTDRDPDLSVVPEAKRWIER